MRYEPRKKMKTATDGNLNVEYVRNQTFITNSPDSPFTAALAEQESIKSELDSVKKEKKEWTAKRFMLEGFQTE